MVYLPQSWPTRSYGKHKEYAVVCNVTIAVWRHSELLSNVVAGQHLTITRLHYHKDRAHDGRHREMTNVGETSPLIKQPNNTSIDSARTDRPKYTCTQGIN